MIPDQNLPVRLEGVAPLAVGQVWFICVDEASNRVRPYKIAGLWRKVVALQRNGETKPEHYLLAALRFVELASA